MQIFSASSLTDYVPNVWRWSWNEAAKLTLK